VSGRSKAKGGGSAVRAGADGTYVRRVEVPQQELRRGFQGVGNESCLGEDMTFDIARHASSKYPVMAV